MGHAAPPLRVANMVDVAKAAGVSHMTVSRVLNGSPSVRPATREKVLAAIDHLGYRRNSAARALVTRRTRTLGVVGFDATLYGPAQMLHGIEQSAHEAGYYLAVASQETPDEDAVQAGFARLAEQAVEGVVVIAQTPALVDAFEQLAFDVPCVVALAGEHATYPSVTVDQVAGARLATRHLLECGASTVWHVAGPSEFFDASDRTAGWRQELGQAGRPAPEPVAGDWSPASGYAAGQVLAAREDVDAVFVANDQMALGVLRALAEAGRRVPEDVMVVGFDDVPEAAYYSPPLTTVRQDFGALGRRSLDLLLEQIAEPRLRGSRDLHAVLPPEVVPRASTARAAAGTPRKTDRKARPR